MESCLLRNQWNSWIQNLGTTNVQNEQRSKTIIKTNTKLLQKTRIRNTIQLQTIPNRLCRRIPQKNRIM